MPSKRSSPKSCDDSKTSTSDPRKDVLFLRARALTEEFVQRVPEDADPRVVVMAGLLFVAGFAIEWDGKSPPTLPAGRRAWVQDGLEFAYDYMLRAAATLLAKETT